jgi:hypothetical protein
MAVLKGFCGRHKYLLYEIFGRNLRPKLINKMESRVNFQIPDIYLWTKFYDLMALKTKKTQL